MFITDLERRAARQLGLEQLAAALRRERAAQADQPAARVGELVLTGAGCVLVCLFVVILRTHATRSVATLLLGALLWVVGDALWLHGDPLVQVVPWWAGFLVLTIVGERLELGASELVGALPQVQPGEAQVGAAERALELTVAYTKDRVQFGRPVGSFQALQHRMADLHILVESARSLSHAAAVAAAGDAPDLALQAAAVKAHCSQLLLTVAAEMIQLHGAIGVTWEHDAHRYFKRAHGSGQLFGAPTAHLARIAHAVIDG